MTDAELAAKTQQYYALRDEIIQERWQRYVAAYPEKNIGDRSWDSLTDLNQRCTDDHNPSEVCKALDGDYDYAPCVFCGMSWSG